MNIQSTTVNLKSSGPEKLVQIIRTSNYPKFYDFFQRSQPMKNLSPLTHPYPSIQQLPFIKAIKYLSFHDTIQDCIKYYKDDHNFESKTRTGKY